MGTTIDRKATGGRPGDSARLEHKTFDCQLKAEGDDGSFELYALAFGNEDRQGDVIAPGAVKNLDELVRDGWGALNHRAMDLPVAYAESAAQDGRGLLIRGKFHTHPEAQACRTVVRERMAAGKSVKCSIGYVVDDASQETRGAAPVRIIKAMRVYEFSFVNLPANPEAGVVSAKSLPREEDPLDTEERGFLALLMKRCGLEVKAGRKISAATHEALSKHASGMAETLSGMQEHHKGYKALCSKMGEQIDEFKSFLDAHKPGKADPDADGDDDSSAEGDTDADAGKKSDSPPDARSLGERRQIAARRLAAAMSLES